MIKEVLVSLHKVAIVVRHLACFRHLSWGVVRVKVIAFYHRLVFSENLFSYRVRARSCGSFATMLTIFFIFFCPFLLFYLVNLLVPVIDHVHMPIFWEVVTSYQCFERLLAFLSKIQNHWLKIFNVLVRLIWPVSINGLLNLINIDAVVPVHQGNPVPACRGRTIWHGHVILRRHGITDPRAIKQFKCQHSLDWWLFNVYLTIFAQK